MKLKLIVAGLSIALSSTSFAVSNNNAVTFKIMDEHVALVTHALRAEVAVTVGTGLTKTNQVISANVDGSTITTNGSGQLAGGYAGRTGVTITGSDVGLTPVQVGDILDGCTVYWVDASTQHGLCVSTKAKNNPVAAYFAASPSSTTPLVTDGQANGYGIGSGAQNTQYWLSAMAAAGGNVSANAIGLVVAETLTSTGEDCDVSELAIEACYGGYSLPSRVEAALLWASGQIDATLSNCTGSTHNNMWTSSSLRGSGTQTWIWSQNSYTSQGHWNIADRELDKACVYPVKQF